ncbi:MAG: alanine--glyoxylate aminotransferase family protein [Gemmatimonadota bacterium]|jgi:alanine-glyoxylate transaminase/serine-glyoxylate transaminase/serine-pyruvate transaminase|nr:alanine--glyoxylate aminotransferase family protein [Gemmatimonadota bacterium]
MPTFSSFVPPRRVLMGPGPSDVSPRVLEALSRPTIGHLDPAFISLMEEIKQLLRYAFQTENELTMPISGPGTAGMETCVVNLVEPGEKVIVCQNGVFGGRLKEMVKRCGGLVIPVDDPWGRAVDPEKVETALRAHPDTAVVAVVHAETSTGALSDVATIAALARNAGALSIVDAVTSLGGSELRTDDWGIDAVYSGTQKCLSVPPGLSPITLNDRAVAKVRGRKTPVQSWFMDLNLILGYWTGGAQRSYHHTAPINALYGLHEGLRVLAEEGIEKSWARHTANHHALRAGLESAGLTFAVPEAERLPQLNSILVPDVVDDAASRKALLERFGLEIGAGLGALAGKVWRIGLMGYASRRENIDLCVEAVETVVREAVTGMPHVQ